MRYAETLTVAYKFVYSYACVCIRICSLVLLCIFVLYTWILVTILVGCIRWEYGFVPRVSCEIFVLFSGGDPVMSLHRERHIYVGLGRAQFALVPPRPFVSLHGKRHECLRGLRNGPVRPLVQRSPVCSSCCCMGVVSFVCVPDPQIHSIL